MKMIGVLDIDARAGIEEKVCKRLGTRKYLARIKEVMDEQSPEELMASGVYLAVMFARGYAAFRPAWMENSLGRVKEI